MGTYVSLFSGIGGLDLAVERFGFRCVAQVEIDADCRRVLEREWPAVPRWGDVSGFAAVPDAVGDAVRAEPVAVSGRVGSPVAGDVDAVIGGFPCQPASVAGKRSGRADDRWLWPEFARVVSRLEPRFVFVENVPGLLTVDGGRAFSEIVGDLADLGYDATWTCVRAAEIGAPHRRDRLFIVADAGRESGEPGGGRGAARGDHARAGTPEPDGDRFLGTSEPGTESPDAASRRVRRGEPSRDAGRAGSGDPSATVGAATDAGRVARTPTGELDGGSGARGIETPPGRAARGSKSVAAGGAAADLEDVGFEGIGDARDGGRRSPDFDFGPYAAAVERWGTVMGPPPRPVDDRGRLEPVFVEWMMGFPRGWTDGLSRTQRLKALGNAVVPQQGAAALEILFGSLEAIA